MKKLLLTLILLIPALTLLAQKDHYLKEGPLSLTIPNDNWMPINPTRTKTSIIYHYKRLNTKDSTGKKAFPEIVITIEQVHADMELTKFSLSKQKPYQSLKGYKAEKVFTDSDGMLRLHYAVGHKAYYEDAHGVKHTFYFIHAIKQNKGIQVIIDTPSSLFDTLEEEFTSVIRSLD